MDTSSHLITVKRCIITALIYLFLSSAALAATDNQTTSTEWPAGMTLKKVGGTNVVVPEGTRVRREGDLQIVEGTGEYAARKFVEIDNHFKTVDSELLELRKEIENIKKNVTDIQRANSFLKSK